MGEDFVHGTVKSSSVAVESVFTAKLTTEKIKIIFI